MSLMVQSRRLMLFERWRNLEGRADVIGVRHGVRIRAVELSPDFG